MPLICLACTKSWPEDEQLVLQSTSLIGPSGNTSSFPDGWLSDDQAGFVWAEVIAPSAHCFRSHVVTNQVLFAHIIQSLPFYFFLDGRLLSNCLLSIGNDIETPLTSYQ